MGGEHGVDGVPVGVGEPGQQRVLAAREADLGAPPLDDLAQGGALGALDPARRHRHAEHPVAVAVLPPAEVIGAVEPLGQLARIGQRVADPALDLGAEPLEAALVDHVLQAGPVAILPVAEVAVDGDHGLDGGCQIVGHHPHQRRRQARVGVVLAGVALAQAAADEHDVAGDAVALDRHQADVLDVDVDAVVAREGEADLELAGEVGLAVERLDRRAPRR